MMLWALMQRATHNMPSGNQAVTFVFSEGLDAIPAITKAAVRKNITKANSTMAKPSGREDCFMAEFLWRCR